MAYRGLISLDTQQLHEIIEQQNQVIVAKDSYIEDLQHKLKEVNGKLCDAEWEISCQKFDEKWASEAIRQKAVHIIGGFKYNTRYIPLEVTVIIVIVTILLTFAVTRQAFL